MPLGRLRRRSPREREAYLEAERRQRLLDGMSPVVLDTAAQVMRDDDRELHERVVAGVAPLVMGFLDRNAGVLAVAPRSVWARVVIDAAVAALTGSGVAEVVDPGVVAGLGWDEAVPAHLRPDVAAAVARWRAAVTGGAGL